MGKHEQIKKLFDVSLNDYDEHMNKTGHYKAQERIIRLIKDGIKEPILDLACGTGFLIKLLSKDFSKVFGNDFSPLMAEAARKRIDAPITNENAENLESYDKKFKTIISCNVFFYLQNREKAIRRWVSLLEKDGKVIFIEEYPFIKPKSEEMNKHTEELMSIIDPISPEDIKNLMAQNGFSLVKNVNTAIDEKHNLYGLVFSLK